jgi:uncharacterized protein (TIGR03067 family)
MNTSLIVGLALVVAAPGPKDAAKPAPKLEGEWVVEKFEGPKEDVPPGGVTLRITENRISIFEAKREKPEEADYTVDLMKKPAHIDIRPVQGGPAKRDLVVYGLLAIDGDTLKLCFAKDGADRPKELKGDGEKGVMLITLKRVKSEKPEK